MRILYAARLYDYGRQAHGTSFEHHNFYEPLVAMGYEVEYFPTDVLLLELGRERMNKELRRRVDARTPDVLFSCLFQDELDPAVVSDITQSTATLTYNWFCDDHWRFDDFSSKWAPSFSWVSTTDHAAVEKYRAIGYANVIKTQWAANARRYRPTGLGCSRDVSFVGQVYGTRPETIRRLATAGIKVDTYGTGWAVRRRDEWLAQRLLVAHLYGAARLARRRASTRVSQEQMIEIFGTTRINLNFTDSSSGMEPQIKGRTFEVPACGGFLLSGTAEDLESYLVPDKEVVVFHDFDDLVEKINWYLGHDEAREAIARAGYRRTISEHTYEQRFTDIFRRMGLT